MYVVIPTLDRRETLEPLLTSLRRHRTIVVDTGDNSWVDGVAWLRLISDREPVSISRWWNEGLDAVSEHQPRGSRWDVAVLNDDLEVPFGTLERLAWSMRAEGCAAAFPDVHGRLSRATVSVLHRSVPHDLYLRMTGYCFVVAGELEMRFDERFSWWYGDDDFEWRAAELGGVMCVGGSTVRHLHPNESTVGDPELARQAERDRAAFVEKWGVPPW